MRQVARVEVWHYHSFIVVGRAAVCGKHGHAKVVLNGLSVAAALVKCTFGEAVSRCNHRKRLHFAEG